MPKQTMQGVGFAMVCNEVLQDKELSFAAKGLFAYLYSKPNTWDFSADRIADDSKEDRKAVLSRLHELEERGYLLRKRRSDGRNAYFLRWDKSHPWPVDNSVDNTVEPQSQKRTEGGSHSPKSGPVSNKDLLFINSNKYSANHISSGDNSRMREQCGGRCRRCGGAVLFLESPVNEKKLRKSYYYTHLYKCSDCRAVYLDNKYKVIIK